MEKEDPRYKIYDDFLDGEFTEAQFKKLEKRTKKLTDEDVALLSQCLGENLGPPIVLRTGLTPEFALDQKLLFHQFFGNSKPSTTMILHNIKRNSTLCQILYASVCYRQIGQLFMSTVEYYITPVGQESMKRAGSGDRLRCRLALSYLGQVERDPLRTQELTTAMEDSLGAVVGRIFLQERRLVLTFEWQEEDTFGFSMACELCGSEKEWAQLHKPITLHRSDLFSEYVVNPDAKEGECDPNEYYVTQYGDKMPRRLLDLLKCAPLAYVAYGYWAKKAYEDDY